MLTLVPATQSGQTVYVEMDDIDVDRLGERKLSIGSHGYAQMWDGKVMLLHRWLMGVPHGTGYRVIVDHIDRDVWNCQRANLRVVSPSESNMNRVIAPRDLPRGVYLTRHGKFAAALKRNRTTKHLGTYSTVEEAVAAREAALREGLIRS